MILLLNPISWFYDKHNQDCNMQGREEDQYLLPLDNTIQP